MKILITADIHSNLPALEAVIEDAGVHGSIDEFWCLGDIVGYGPQPGECINVLRRYNAVCVAGNHDRAVIGKLDYSWFNPEAVVAGRWTSTRLSLNQKVWLENLPLKIIKDDVLLVHGSPSDMLLEYIISASIAERNFAFFENRFCFCGHTHRPVAFRKDIGEVKTIGLKPGIGLVMSENRMIINPGSVGQPRDGDPRAAYAVYDTESGILRLERIEYDIRATQDKMMEVGLPVRLITRLEQGR